MIKHKSGLKHPKRGLKTYISKTVKLKIIQNKKIPFWKRINNKNKYGKMELKKIENYGNSSFF